jgi:hypothetical protein
MSDGGYDEDTLAGKLEGLAPNTAQNPYTIALDSSVSINMETASARAAWAAITSTIAGKAKYVVLDLRRCAAPETLSGSLGSVIHDNEYIKGIILPLALTGIGRGAFSGCDSLTIVSIADGVTSIGVFAFRNCDSLTDVVIPGSVTGIGESAFDGCTNLTDVTFGFGSAIASKDFGAGAFRGNLRTATAASIRQFWFVRYGLFKGPPHPAVLVRQGEFAA